MNDSIAQTRAALVETAARLFARNLLDMAGGNLSVRVGDVVCITPRYSGLKKHWDLRPDDVMVVSLEGQILEGHGELSREGKVHLKLQREFNPYGNAVIHAHSRHMLVFAALAQPIPPVLEATRKFGTIQVVDFAPSHSADLAEHVAGAIRGQEARIAKQAAGVIAPYHGLFLMGKDLDNAADAVERIDTNAFCILMGKALGGGADQNANMEASISLYEKNAVK
ncbi:MAG: class II aldolase/adducin family protein [Anaerolineae bacterium]|nr:class II aldolase/adducin family protein [Anaerolineae bacterium]